MSHTLLSPINSGSEGRLELYIGVLCVVTTVSFEAVAIQSIWTINLSLSYTDPKVEWKECCHLQIQSQLKSLLRNRQNHLKVPMETQDFR